MLCVAAPMLPFPLRETPRRVACHNVCDPAVLGRGCSCTQAAPTVGQKDKRDGSAKVQPPDGYLFWLTGFPGWETGRGGCEGRLEMPMEGTIRPKDSDPERTMLPKDKRAE